MVGYDLGNDIDDVGPTIETYIVKPLEDENKQLTDPKVLEDPFLSLSPPLKQMR